MSKPMILHYAPDNASLIVRLVLEEMGLTYETRLVDRRVTEQRSPQYLALNPAGRIPTLETALGPISETAAILLWLSETTATMGPPPGHPERGAFLNTLFFTSNTLHAELAQLFYLYRYGPEPSLPDMARRWHKRLSRHFELIDGIAQTGRFGLASEAPCVLDPYFAALCRWAGLYPAGGCDWFDLGRFPGLLAVATAFERRGSTARLVEAEGMSPHPFTAPRIPSPPEGSAT